MATAWSEIRTRIRQRTDNEYTDGEFVTDAELLILANRSRKQLFGMLVEAGLHTVPETIYTIPVDGSLTYALPNDCYAVGGVFRLETDYYIRLDRHDQRTHPRDTTETIAWSYRTHGELEDAVIELNPRVSTGTYKIRYATMPTDFSADDDEMDGVLGWEEWVVLDVSIDLLTKEKVWDAVAMLQQRMDKLTQKIEAQASERDMSEFIAVADVRRPHSNTLFDDNGFLPGGYRGVRGYWGSF